MTERWEPRRFRWGMRQAILFIAICFVAMIALFMYAFSVLAVEIRVETPFGPDSTPTAGP